MSLTGVTTVDIPAAVLDECRRHFLYMADRHSEGIALLVGPTSSPRFAVSQAVIPEQVGLVTDKGVSIWVEEQELHRLNVWLFNNRLTILGQVHSHPGDAYHSSVDNDFAISAAAGSFSIVVPDFAADQIDLGLCAVFRLSSQGTWIEMRPAEVERIFQVT